MKGRKCCVFLCVSDEFWVCWSLWRVLYCLGRHCKIPLSEKWTLDLHLNQMLPVNTHRLLQLWLCSPPNTTYEHESLSLFSISGQPTNTLVINSGVIIRAFDQLPLTLKLYGNLFLFSKTLWNKQMFISMFTLMLLESFFFFVIRWNRNLHDLNEWYQYR